VAFFKPSASDNQHPGYASIHAADKKVDHVIKAIQSNAKLWKHSVIIITYDENGGLWDHVAPPKGDRWGPGTRVPTIIVSPYAKKGFVDHRVYDTTSIMRFIEWKYNLEPLGERHSANLAEVF
jgi:phospholipase C